MATRKISGITGELILEVNKWSGPIKQAEKDAKALESALKPTKELATSIGTAMTAAGVAIGGALLGAAKSAADYGDKIGEVSEKTGIATEDLSKLKFAAEQSDTSFEGLASGVKILEKNLFEAATGSKEQKKLFDALGISTKDVTGEIRPLNDVLLDAADVFEELPDGTEKAAVAMKLFGKSGADLIPFLNQGREGIEKLGDEAERLGLVIDPATAALGDDFNNALNRSKNAMQGLGISIGTVLLPALTNVADKATDTITWVGDLTREFPLVTKGAAGLAIALTGAGGLLLGLSAIATIAPKVAYGLTLIKSAAATGDILLAVRSYGDLRAAISLIGESGIAAKAGLIGLAAAVGYLTGEFINGQIAARGWTDELDYVTKTATEGIPIIGKWITGQSNLDDAQRQHNATLAKSAELLKKHGVTQEQATAKAKSLFDQNQKLKASQKAAGDAADGHERKLRDLIASLQKGESAADKYEKETASLKAQFESSLRPADDLMKTIRRQADVSKDAANIIKVHGLQIIETTEQQKKWGFEIANDNRLLYAMALAAREAADGVALIPAAIGESLVSLDQLLNRPAAMDFAAIGDRLPGQEGGGPALPKSLGSQALQTFAEMEAQIRETELAVRDFDAAGISAGTIMTLMGSEVLRTAENAEKLGITLDPVTQKVLEQAEALKRAADFQQAWGDAFASIGTGMADMFADLEFSLTRLGEIGQSAAQSMLDAFMKGFFSPLTEALSDLGKGFAKEISGALFGGDKGGGLLGGLLGNIPGLGGLFGGGAAATTVGLGASVAPIGMLADEALASSIALMGVAPAAPGAAVAAGATSAAGGGGLLSTAVGFATNPITIAAAGAIVAGLLINNKVGQGRKTADIFVESIQNPFGTTGNEFFTGLKNIIDPITAAEQAGTLTLDMAQEAMAKLNADFETFKRLSDEFIQQSGGVGGKEELVVGQAFDTLNPIIDRLRTDLQADIDRLTAVADSTAQEASTAPREATFTLTIAPVFNFDGHSLTPIVIRDVVMPEITTLLETAGRGFRERWKQLLLDMDGSAGTEVPVGI